MGYDGDEGMKPLTFRCAWKWAYPVFMVIFSQEYQWIWCYDAMDLGSHWRGFFWVTWLLISSSWDKEKTELLGGIMYDYKTTKNITRIRLQQRNGMLRSRQFQRASFKRDSRPRNMWRQFLDFSVLAPGKIIKNHEKTVQLCPTVDG